MNFVDDREIRKGGSVGTNSRQRVRLVNVLDGEQLSSLTANIAKITARPAIASSFYSSQTREFLQAP